MAEQNRSPVNTNDRYTCKEYREEMILVGLQKQLEQENLSQEKREEIETEIRKIEKIIGF